MVKISSCREAIINLSQSNMKSSAISASLKCSLSLVYKVLKQWKISGTVAEKKKIGRPRTVNTRRNRAIIKKRITRNDGVSLNQMAKNLQISRSSLQTIVHNDLNLRSYRLYKGQFLTDQAKLNRKEKCKNLCDFFKVRRIEDVLWSDEKIFTIEVARNAQNNRQLLNPSLKNTRKRKIATKCLFPKCLMVWGGISAAGKTSLIFIDKKVKINANVYQEEILEKALVPWKRNNPNVIFQQDWAPAHGAKTTIRFLETKIGSFMTKDMWPANSPDLNPLDFSVWGFMEKQLRSRKVQNLDNLRKEIIKIWNDLDINYLRRTIDSVKKRFEACIEADGGHFENSL